MVGFNLPLGGFEIHFAESLVANAIPSLQELLKEYNTILETAFAENQQNREAQEHALESIPEESCIQKLKKAVEKFIRSIEVSECPVVLPRITVQFIFSSIVAQALRFSFSVIDYELNVDDKGRSYWWVVGRITDKHGRTQERPGTSFMFDKNNEKMAEGALLSACADALVYCVSSMVPFFPREWDRWEYKNHSV